MQDRKTDDNGSPGGCGRQRPDDAQERQSRGGRLRMRRSPGVGAAFLFGL